MSIKEQFNNIKKKAITTVAWKKVDEATEWLNKPEHSDEKLALELLAVGAVLVIFNNKLRSKSMRTQTASTVINVIK